MGVNRTDYVMLAVKLPFEAIEDTDCYEDDGYSDKITSHNGLTVVSDGMNGNYLFIGRIIRKAIKGYGLDITDCSASTFLEMELLKILIKSEFNIDAPVRVWAFTHWH